MLFNSVQYILIFLPIVFFLYFFINKLKLFKIATIFLLFASLFFYGSYKIEYVYILIVSIVINYLFSLLFKRNLTSKQKTITLILALITNIGILVGFKYFVFLADIYTTLIHAPFNAMEYIMPLGISFFTLQQISYVIDCYKGNVKDYNFFDYALFVSFFPQLVAGPIVRHQEMIPQFNDLSKRIINQQNIFIGIFLITIGLLKKVIFADNFTTFIDTVMKYDIYTDFGVSWFLGIAKVLQGYFDFSGYCDMALGSAFLFNISLPWNFNSPYKAQSIIDYWSRWNMTLVRFLKDYIYFPLMKRFNNIVLSNEGSTLNNGENEFALKEDTINFSLTSIGTNETKYPKNLFCTCISIMIVFLIYGLWKGTNPVNVVYGLLNGILVCINKLWENLKIKIPKVISILITFITLVLLTPFIGIDKFEDSFSILKSMFGFAQSFEQINFSGINLKFFPIPFDLKLNWIILLICLYVVFISKNSTQLAQAYSEKNNIFYTIILAIIFFISTLFITKSTEFIYFIF